MCGYINCKKNLWRAAMKKNSIFLWSVDLFKPRSELGPRPRPGPNHWKVSKCKVCTISFERLETSP